LALCCEREEPGRHTLVGYYQSCGRPSARVMRRGELRERETVLDVD
jgi:hypothetical protein